MSIITKMRKQKALWWKRLEANEYGRYSYDAPVEIDCRWDDVADLGRKPSPPSEKIASSTVVYVDRVMTPGDKLREGGLESSTESDPENDEGALVIERFVVTPNLKATESLYTAYL